MLSLLVNTADPQQGGLLSNFLTQGFAAPPQFVENDTLLAITHRPVKPSTTSYRPWDDDFIAGDTFQIAIGNPGQAPTSGTFLMGVLRSGSPIAIGTISTGTPANIQATGHGMTTGDVVFFPVATGSTPNLQGLYFIATVVDANNFTIPEDVTVGSSATGTIQSYSTSGLSTLPYNVTATALTTALNTVLTTLGYPNVTASILSNGDYEISGNTAGLIPQLYALGNGLVPQSMAIVNQIIPGSGVTEALQILSLQQSPVAFSQPSTLAPAAAVTATIAQAGGASADKIYSIAFTAGTYDGTYSIAITNKVGVTATVTASALMSLSDMSNLFNASSNLTQGDIAIAGSVATGYTVQFQGTQANSNAPTIVVTNINLLAPMGVSGTMNLNTVNLYIAFSQTSASTLPFTLSIRRTRATGEQSEYYQTGVTLKRNLINPATMIPLSMATYYTTGQIDAMMALKANMDASGNVLVGAEARFQIITHGVKIQTSNDGGATWNDGPSYNS